MDSFLFDHATAFFDDAIDQSLVLPSVRVGEVTAAACAENNVEGVVRLDRGDGRMIGIGT